MPGPRTRTQAGVDWAEIRRRIDAVARAIDGSTELSDDRARDILEQRARLLARPITTSTATEGVEVLTFTLGRETYAIETRYVMAVFGLSEMSRLPGVEPPVFGIAGWRGSLLTILDLRQLLGVSSATLNDLGRVLVLGDERPAFGVLADTVLELTTLPASTIHAAPDVASRSVYVRGVTSDAVLLLDAAKLLKAHG